MFIIHLLNFIEKYLIILGPVLTPIRNTNVFNGTFLQNCPSLFCWIFREKFNGKRKRKVFKPLGFFLFFRLLKNLDNSAMFSHLGQNWNFSRAPESNGTPKVRNLQKVSEASDRGEKKLPGRTWPRPSTYLV